MGVASAGVCEKHELPLDPRGECELCRLSAMPSKPPPTRATSWIVVGLAVVLLGGGIVAFRAAPTSESEPPPRGVPGNAPRAEPTPAPERRAPEPAQPRERADRPTSVPLPPGLSDAPGTWRVQAAPTQAARPSSDEPAFTEADAREALAEVRIEMYATAWCPSCRRAREYLDYNDIAYTEYDIDTNADAKAHLAKINPRTSIPTFQIDGIVQVGFSPENFQRQLNEAIRRRLR